MDSINAVGTHKSSKKAVEPPPIPNRDLLNPPHTTEPTKHPHLPTLQPAETTQAYWTLTQQEKAQWRAEEIRKQQLRQQLERTKEASVKL